MLIGDIVQAIEQEQLKIQTLADVYGVSGRTISTKIKDSGYQWNPRQAQYDYVGDNRADSEQIVIENLFNKTVPFFDTVEQINQAEPQVDSYKPKKPKRAVKDLSKMNTPKKRKNAPTSSNKATRGSQMDRIDYLLDDGAGDGDKAYRGFYMENDVLEILDRVPKGNKSELVNEALRIIFKEKGLI